MKFEPLGGKTKLLNNLKFNLFELLCYAYDQSKPPSKKIFPCELICNVARI